MWSAPSVTHAVVVAANTVVYGLCFGRRHMLCLRPRQQAGRKLSPLCLCGDHDDHRKCWAQVAASLQRQRLVDAHKSEQAAKQEEGAAAQVRFILILKCVSVQGLIHGFSWVLCRTECALVLYRSLQLRASFHM